MSNFPYPPGDYDVKSVAEVEGVRRAVAGDPVILEWVSEKGMDPNDVYRLRTFGSFVLIYRFRNDRTGRKYVSRIKRVLSRGLVNEPAKRLPKVVAAGSPNKETP